MLDPLTLQLFGQFPREVANPSRAIASGPEDFRNFLAINEGQRDCYTSVYPLSGEVDKLFYDFDGHARALDDAKRVYKYLVDRGFTVVPVASGKKGIHLYILLSPMLYDDPKKLLMNASYYILSSVFGDEYYKTTADPHVIGDVRRITRIPNTRRPPENNSWCTWLSSDFVTARWLDIINWCKMPHEFPRVKLSKKTLLDFPKVDAKYMAMENHIQQDNLQASTKHNGLLEGHLRPCLYRLITLPSPSHMVRVACTVDLLKFWSNNDIVHMYSSLGWIDWSVSETRKQISSCAALK